MALNEEHSNIRKKILQNIFWIVLSIIIFKSIEYIYETEEISILALISLGVGVFLFVHHPFEDAKELPQALEMGLATAFVGAFVIHFGLVVLAPILNQEETDTKPCGPKTKEAQCYTLTHSACLSAWDHFDEECRKEAASNMSRPTQLVGAFAKHCIQFKLNKYMSFNQKKDSLVCQEYFNSLVK
jgi:hypothetical protein